jgi:2-oxoglutarate dehydrogenase E1 component
VLTPKSLLRHPRAGASLADLTGGGFQPVLDDVAVSDRAAVTRLILCSGKVAVDLAGERPENAAWVAVARVEQLYPFPADALRDLVAAYPHLREVVWVQEEPRNNGAWTYIAPRLAAALPSDLAAHLRYDGRPEMASTAEGMPDAHAAEQARIIATAYGGESGSRAVGQSGSDAVGVWSGREAGERAKLS